MVRVFVVTGSNKGIGKSIVKLLLKDNEEKIVYLTSRNQEAGENAVKDLEKEGFNPKYHQLDITNEKSVLKLRDYLVDNHGGLDVLVNNAGIAYKRDSTAPLGEQARVTVDCNFYGTLSMSEAMFPILKKNGRVVNVSSLASRTAYKGLSDEMKKKFSDPNLTMDGLKALVEEYVEAAIKGNVDEEGFFERAYPMSKVAVTLMTQIQQKDVDISYPDKNILVNSCCPGYCATDMTNHKGPLHVDEGADTPTFLALIPVDATSPKGLLYEVRKVIQYPP